MKRKHILVTILVMIMSVFYDTHLNSTIFTNSGCLLYETDRIVRGEASRRPDVEGSVKKAEALLSTQDFGEDLDSYIQEILDSFHDLVSFTNNPTNYQISPSDLEYINTLLSKVKERLIEIGQPVLKYVIPPEFYPEDILIAAGIDIDIVENLSWCLQSKEYTIRDKSIIAEGLGLAIGEGIIGLHETKD